MDETNTRSRLPDVAGFFTRNAVRITGFVAGGLGTLMIGLLFSVFYTGQGVGTTPDPVPQVYTNF